MIVEVNSKQINKFLKQLKPGLSEFFDCEINYPKFVFLKSPKRFTRTFTGSKKRQVNPIDVVSEYEQTSAFYDHEKNKVYIPAFIRAGYCTFESHNTTNIKAQYIIHELIHAFQYQNGGYSCSDLFDEGTAEICAYILAGRIQPESGQDYFEWVSYIYALLESVGYDNNGIAVFAKEYVSLPSKKKDLVIEEVFRKYVKKYGLNRRWSTIHNALQSYDVKLISTLPKLNKIDNETIQDNLYSLFEIHRII